MSLQRRSAPVVTALVASSLLGASSVQSPLAPGRVAATGVGATAAGRALALGPVEVVEVEVRKSGKAAEAEALGPHLKDAHVIACDERGTARGSADFAQEIGRAHV